MFLITNALTKFKRHIGNLMMIIALLSCYSLSLADGADFDSATIYPGSLKQNVQRILNDAGWQKVVWGVPYDYSWVGQTQISGSSVQNVMQQLLAHYPLQAVFYDENHVVLIRSREV